MEDTVVVVAQLSLLTTFVFSVWAILNNNGASIYPIAVCIVSMLMLLQVRFLGEPFMRRNWGGATFVHTCLLHALIFLLLWLSSMAMVDVKQVREGAGAWRRSLSAEQ